MRVAFVSPLPPGEYGVPVYSARTVEALSRHAEIDVVARTLPPINTLRKVRKVLEAHQPRSLDDYDAAFFVYGNHEHHVDALRFASMTNRGVAIFHDAQQLDFARLIFSEAEMIEIAARRLGKEVTIDDLHMWIRERRSLPFPFIEPTSDFGHIGVAHSPQQVSAFGEYYPSLKVNYAPVAIQHVFPRSMLSPDYILRAKIRCGVHEDSIAIGTCGFVHEEKLPKLYLSALRHLHDWGMNVDFWFVGSVTEESRKRIRAMAEALDLADHVKFSGRVSETQYCDFLLALDLAIQVRRPYFGQLSGAVLDCVAAGLPTVCTNALAAAIEAPASVERIKDHFSSIDIAEACLPLFESGIRRNRYSDEWAGFCADHSFENYAKRLLAISEGL